MLQYKDTPTQEEGNCRFTRADEYTDTRPSKMGFNAWVRVGAVGASPGAAASSTGCGSASLRSSSPLAPPPFFMYDDTIGHATLAACYAHTHHNTAPWATTSLASSHIALSIWIWEALARHPARVLEPSAARLFVVPAFGALSEAVGSCGGTSHYDRMLAAATALRGQRSFVLHARAHVLVSAADTPRNLLGELGTIAAARNASAACLDPKLCGRFRADQALAIPWAPLPALASSSVRAAADAEACRGGALRPRPISIYFRGMLGSTQSAQSLRVRLGLLRRISGADVRFIGSERDPLWPPVQQFASTFKVSTKREKADVELYAKSMLRARFCACPTGDVPSPGRRLADAVAAGCVPIVIGDKPTLPFDRVLDYTKFAGFIPRAAFLRDPTLAFEATIHSLEPRLPEMRRALADARGWLGYGDADRGPAYNSTAGAAAQLLLHAAALRLP